VLDGAISDHEIVSLGSGPYTARCSCGWSATSASSARYAHNRARIHLGEIRTTAQVRRVQLMSAQAMQRADELAEIRAVFARRREVLLRQRRQLRAMRDRRLAGAVPEPVRSPARLLDTARQMAGLDFGQLWLDYIALGGNCLPEHLTELLRGERPMPQIDYDILAAALNERFAEVGFGHPIEDWSM
jgi:hypothetical protein